MINGGAQHSTRNLTAALVVHEVMDLHRADHQFGEGHELDNHVHQLHTVHVYTVYIRQEGRLSMFGIFTLHTLVLCAHSDTVAT